MCTHGRSAEPHTSPVWPESSPSTAPPSWQPPWRTRPPCSITTLTPHLADPDRLRHWGRLLDAAVRELALDDPRTGAARALDLLDKAQATEGSARGLLDLDSELYRAVNPADRPGENDYDGYDIAALALDLASRWDTELVSRARTAVDPSLHC